MLLRKYVIPESVYHNGVSSLFSRRSSRLGLENQDCCFLFVI
jgi:hypothetical protein